MQETQVQSLGWKDSLEKEIAMHSSIFAWRIPWTVEPGGLQFMGHKESDMTERLTLSHILAYHLTFPLCRYLRKINKNRCSPKEDSLSSRHLFMVILALILFSC